MLSLAQTFLVHLIFTFISYFSEIFVVDSAFLFYFAY